MPSVLLVSAAAALGVGYLPATTQSGQAIVALLALAKDCAQGKNKICDARAIWRLLLTSYREIPSPYTENAGAIVAKLGAGALMGRVAIVTGASSGIGLETTRVLLANGCKVVLAVRSKAKGEKLLGSLPGAENGIVMELELGDLDSVKAFAQEFGKLELPLHYLVNNAGIMSTPFALSKQGFESQFATNHLGHFLLTRLLEPKLLSLESPNPPSRVIFVSSCIHDQWTNSSVGNISQHLSGLIPPTGPYDPMLSYAWSKALNVMTARAFHSRWGSEQRAVAVALHPGIVATNLLTHTGIATPGQPTVPPYEALFMGPLFSFSHKDVGQGASTTLYAMLTSDVTAGHTYFQNNAPQLPSHLVLQEGVAEEAFRLSEELVSGWL